MNAQSNASSASISAALTTVLIVLDQRMGWNFGAEFMGAALVVAFALPAFGIAAIRYMRRARKEITADETEKE